MAEARPLQAPELRTPRLLLRPHRISDFEAMAAMWADPATVRYIGDGHPIDQDMVWARIQRLAGSWPLLGLGVWAMEEIATGRVVGELGFLERRRESVERGEPEVGWGLASDARGRGFAGEALEAVLAWGDERFERTICVISSENLPSVKLARKYGYRETGPAPSDPPPLVQFERIRPGRAG